MIINVEPFSQIGNFQSELPIRGFTPTHLPRLSSSQGGYHLPIDPRQAVLACTVIYENCVRFKVILILI